MVDLPLEHLRHPLEGQSLQVAGHGGNLLVLRRAIDAAQPADQRRAMVLIVRIEGLLHLLLDGAVKCGTLPRRDLAVVRNRLLVELEQPLRKPIDLLTIGRMRELLLKDRFAAGEVALLLQEGDERRKRLVGR